MQSLGDMLDSDIVRNLDMVEAFFVLIRHNISLVTIPRPRLDLIECVLV